MTEEIPVHIPVLLHEIVEWLAPRPGGVVVDGTLGGGGHTRALAERVGPEGLVIALDRDTEALERAEQGLAGLPVKLVHANFCDLPEVLDELRIAAVAGVVLDLGMSSDQLSDAERGIQFFVARYARSAFRPFAGRARLAAGESAQRGAPGRPDLSVRRRTPQPADRGRRSSRSGTRIPSGPPRRWRSWYGGACRLRGTARGSIRLRGPSRPCASR